MWSLLIPEADCHSQGDPGVAHKMLWGCSFPQTVVLPRVFGGCALSPLNQHFSSATAHTKAAIRANLQSVLFLNS